MQGKFICSIVLIVTLLVVQCCCLKGETADLIVRYLEDNEAKFCFFFTCWSKRDQVELQQKLLNLFIRTSYIRLDDITLSSINLKNYEKVSFVVDFNCNDAINILVEAGLTKKFIFLYSWLFILNQTTDIQELFDKVKTRMDMDVKIAIPDEQNGYDIHEIFNPGINSKLQIRNYGHFNGNNLTIYNNESYYNSRKKLSEVLIRSANVVHYPYKTSFHEYMTDLRLRQHDIYSKFHYQLFLTLQEIHEFDFNMTLRWSWFGNTSSGEDGGMAKLLYEETVDISSAGGIMRLIRSDRIHFYDYIMPYYKFRSCFFFRNPGLVKPNFYEVLKPFATITWYAILLTSLLVCVSIEISDFVARKIGSTNQSWISSLFIAIAVFSQQGLAVVPEHLTGRIIFLNLLILSILLYNYYTSSLVSSLISTSPEVFTTLKDLYESSLTVGMEPIPYTITYMLDTSKRDYYLRMLNATKIYENMNKPNYMNADEGIEMVRRGGFAYHIEAITAYPLISRTFDQDTLCDLAEISLLIGDTSLMTGKVSQYKKLFQVSLRKMWERGIMRKLYNTWVEKMPDCLSNARVISVSKNDLFLPYFILFVGVVTSFIIFVAETLYYRYQKRKTNRKIDEEKGLFTFVH